MKTASLIKPFAHCADCEHSVPYTPCKIHRIAPVDGREIGHCACNAHDLRNVTTAAPAIVDHLDENGWWHSVTLCFRGPA